MRMECVTADYCIANNLYPFEKECLERCPAKYTNVNPKTKKRSKTQCFPCLGPCPLECSPMEIDTVGKSQHFSGCQILISNLEISIQSMLPDTMKALEKNLGDIEEVYGYVKIARSPAITSLNFLRSLKKVKGQFLENDKYSFVLVSNDNLQSIWDFNEKQNFNLERGNLMIHDNSKLCMSEINKFQAQVKTNKSDWISLDTNGYEEMCRASELDCRYQNESAYNATIFWRPIDYSKKASQMTNYTIYYIQAPEKNITHVGIDSCAT